MKAKDYWKFVVELASNSGVPFRRGVLVPFEYNQRKAYDIVCDTFPGFNKIIPAPKSGTWKAGIGNSIAFVYDGTKFTQEKVEWENAVSNRNLKILKDVLSGHTCEDVAKEHGISSPRVHQIIRRAATRAGFEAQDSTRWLKEARTDAAHILAVDPSNL